MDLWQPKIIAHRGASALVDHENTIEAFEKAIEIGAHMMEFDIRMTKDKVMVSYHDETIKEGVKIADLTHQALNEKTSALGFRVPTVEEIFILGRGKILFDIELKESGYEEEVVRLAKQYLDYDMYLMKSFLDEVIIKIKSLDPRIKTGLLLGTSKPKPYLLTRYSEIFPWYRIKKTKPDFIGPYYKLLRFNYVKRMKRLNMPLYVWTVNEPQVMDDLIDQGVVGVITDYPDIGLKSMNNKKQSV